MAEGRTGVGIGPGDPSTRGPTGRPPGTIDPGAEGPARCAMIVNRRGPPGKRGGPNLAGVRRASPGTNYHRDRFFGETMTTDRMHSPIHLRVRPSIPRP